MRWIVLILVLISCVSANATEKIEGIVKEKQSGEAITNAVVTVLALPDSIYCSAAVTDASGKFLLSEPEDGRRYVLKVTAPGCKAQVVESVPPVMEILLEAWESGLQEVVVTGRKQDLKMILQGFSFDPKHVYTHSNNALDLLKYAPLIELKEGKYPKLIGKENTIIHINGRKSQKSEEQILAELAAMPASNIKNIEMLVNTGSRYASDSDTGIINIEIREPHEGLLGRALFYSNISEGQNDESPALSLDYSRGKFNVSGYLGFTQNMYREYMDYAFEDFLSGMKEESTNRDRRHSSVCWISAAGGYSISENQRIELSGHISGSGKHRTLNDRSSVTLNDETTELLHRSISRAPFRIKRASGGLGYYLKFKPDGSNIQADIDYSYSQSHSNIENFYNGDFLPQRESDYNTDISGAFTVYQRFGDNNSLKYGYNFQYRQMHDLSIYESDPTVVNRFMHSSHYNSTVNSQNIFVDYFWQPINTFYLSAGFRGEYLDIKGDLKLPENDSFRMSKWDWSPQISAQWSIKPLHTLLVSFRRRVYWPDEYQMNPEKQWESEYRYTTGNPNLLPEIYYTAQATYSFLNYYFLKFAYSHSGDRYVQYAGPGEGDNTIATTYRKYIGNTNSIKPSFIFQKSFFNYRWTLSSELVYEWTKVNYLREDGSAERFCDSRMYVSVSNNIIVLKKQKLNAIVCLFASSPFKSLGYSNNDWYGMLYLALTKTFPFGELSVSVPWINFLQMKPQGSVVTDTYRSYRKSANNAGGIYISFAYNFGNRSVTRNKVRIAK